jgi:hypothetical protein
MDMAKKMQQVSFRSIEEFFDFLPGKERTITEMLRKIVLDCLPNCTEKLSYNVPYYKIRKNICFIWPASVTWGSKVTYEGVRFGFTQGYLLRDETNFLDKGGRKQVYWKDFKSIRDIDIDLLRTMLFEAAEIDSGYSKK